MTGPTIVVVMEAVDAAPACLRAAADAAAALDHPRIEVLNVRMDAAGTLLIPDVLTERYEQAIDRRSAAESDALRAAFDAWRASAQVVDVIWTEIKGVPAGVVRDRGRQAALLVLARPTDASHPASAAAFDAALFDTGKPVLVVPPGAGAPFGRHLAVGWRDAPATRRSLTALRPWLMAAATVSVIAVTDDDNDAALPEDWKAANLPPGANLHVVRPAGRSDAAALLGKVAALGADGLAMGGFRHGRLVERLLGGVTAEVLRDATIPILMQV